MRKPLLRVAGSERTMLKYMTSSQQSFVRPNILPLRSDAPRPKLLQQARQFDIDARSTEEASASSPKMELN